AFGGFMHSLDIERTGSPWMATTTGRKTKWHDAYHRLSFLSQDVIRVEEGWHRLPLGALARNEAIAKSFGLLLWPLALLFDPIPGMTLQVHPMRRLHCMLRRILSVA